MSSSFCANWKALESGTALDLMSNTTSTSDYVSKTHANTREELVKHTYHFIRNIRSPHESVAPMIFSGSSPLSKPRATRMSSCRTIKTECVFIGNKQINTGVCNSHFRVKCTTPTMAWNTNGGEPLSKRRRGPLARRRCCWRPACDPSAAADPRGSVQKCSGKTSPL